MLRSSMRAAIQCLQPRSGNCLFADLSYAEIGEVLGVAEGTVAATLSKAHQQLRVELSTGEVMA